MNHLARELRRRAKDIPAAQHTLARPIGPDGAVSYCAPTAVLQECNEREMSATFVICTKVEDREADIVEPRGCEEFLDEYRKNPIVLFEHDVQSPIGTCEDDSKNLALRINDDSIIAKCKFHCLPFRGMHLSEEVFHLVCKGVIRGASVGFLPVQSQKRGYGKDSGYHFTKWRMTEWSITPQPVNQDALRMSLSGGYIKTKSLIHRLEQLVIPGPAWSNGADLGASSMSKKLRTAKIAFDKSIFADKDAATAWLKNRGYDASVCETDPTSFIFTQRDGALIPGSQKSLANGVTALLTKAAKEDDEEYESPEAETETDEAADTTEETTDDDASEGDDVVDATESETADEDATGEEEAEELPEDLIGQARDLMNMVKHFELAIHHLPEFSSRAKPEVKAKYDALVSDCQAVVDDLRAIAEEHYAGPALDALVGDQEPAETETPIDDVTVDEMPMDEPPADEEPAIEGDMDEDEILKALKGATETIKRARPVANRWAKSLAKAK